MDESAPMIGSHTSSRCRGFIMQKVHMFRVSIICVVANGGMHQGKSAIYL